MLLAHMFFVRVYTGSSKTHGAWKDFNNSKTLNPYGSYKTSNPVMPQVTYKNNKEMRFTGLSLETREIYSAKKHRTTYSKEKEKDLHRQQLFVRTK